MIVVLVREWGVPNIFREIPGETLVEVFSGWRPVEILLQDAPRGSTVRIRDSKGAREYWTGVVQEACAKQLAGLKIGQFS